ncbi:MAG: hypothetical protein LBT16_02165 [Treponema sp.]|nr:hypothetical protein [Treponema sp.]
MAEKAGTQIAAQSVGGAVFRILSNSVLRKAGIKCFTTICHRFFLFQYKAAFFPGRIPVTAVDHPLDREIPFSSRWVTVYLDFVAFWVRTVGFFLTRYGRKAIEPAADFLSSMGRLYCFASEIYRKNLSTTNRPFCPKPRFVMIYAADPHLLCIPSLHVMIVIRTYTKFRDMIRKMGKEDENAGPIEELYRGALDITEAILYVKQHSVNCIPAAMYTMTCFEPTLFGEEEAVLFASHLFLRNGSPEKSGDIREYIIARYRRFLEESRSGGDWGEPLLRFLKDPSEITRIACRRRF